MIDAVQPVRGSRMEYALPRCFRVSGRSWSDIVFCGIHYWPRCPHKGIEDRINDHLLSQVPLTCIMHKGESTHQ
ncbi:hypothetical protein SCLCIDRAFT_1109920 [Scleroderma citrinum Foug A]|uniref:Uncharacterized protein n=1 Tax=Scleroderma citrinum Foug A TaxID=1036808 RepID=A0A0C3EH73_9AGAM|nr:hypothetical protein SCLCIDRAFT_1109920 [Scleroderma citrinum Foug A]